MGWVWLIGLSNWQIPFSQQDTHPIILRERKMEIYGLEEIVVVEFTIHQALVATQG